MKKHLILQLAILILPLSAEQLRRDDIIIVEITAQDLGLKIHSMQSYHENPELRGKFRKATADFILAAATKARFLMLDIWYSDLLGSPVDQELIKAISSTKKITLASAGFYKNKIEPTLRDFREAVPELGHVLLNDREQAVFYVNPVLCADGADYNTSPTECAPERRERHIGLVAAEGFLGKKLKHPTDGSFKFPRHYFRGFKRITYSKFMQDTDLINDKLVIVVVKPMANLDMHKITKGKKITGSEILAETVLIYANNFYE